MKVKGLWILVLDNFKDTINIILLVAAVVSLAIGILKDGFPDGLIDGASILVALCIIIVVGSGNKYIAELRLAKIVASSNIQEVACLRDGSSTEFTSLDTRELVVGDVFKFK